MTTINPYLSFKGNCEEAFNFYKSVFGGEFQYLGRYKDIPPNDKQNFSPESDQKIMHISLPISKETILMGCDNADVSGEKTIIGNNISLSIDIADHEEADRIFAKLSVGAQIKMSMSETFWGAYFGALTDRFGINWSINCELSQST